jgi:hypothetical protein
VKIDIGKKSTSENESTLRAYAGEVKKTIELADIIIEVW